MALFKKAVLPIVQIVPPASETITGKTPLLKKPAAKKIKKVKKFFRW